MKLSPRERQVMILLTTGYSGKEIAAKMCITYHTVRAFWKIVYRKTETHNIALLTHYAISEGHIEILKDSAARYMQDNNLRSA